ncbi:pseudouridine synthase [Konateibacter massiliensis]|uniref:pseudouridine synthase n=1 Tax=Konateibacter massiliensis TaxID=2002841 RepID=UPI002F418FFB
MDKFLSESSIGRRKEVRLFIKDGKVSVNGRTELVPAAEIDEENDKIAYMGVPVKHGEKVYYMFHKPAGCITARKDAKEKTVMDYFAELDNNGLFPVGRLDKDTEGLLFVTNDGEFNHALMYPEHHVNKKYFFWAFGELTEEKVKMLQEGLFLENKEFYTKEAEVELIKQGLFSELVQEISGNKYEKVKKNRDIQPVVAGYLTISEGCKHQVKRMLKAVGCYVIYLKRVSIGTVSLDTDLKQGEYRLLTKAEISGLLGEEG